MHDDERGTVRDVRIWMNNPLRYRGDTLYQSSFDAETEKGTVLQVVDNKVWMAPYVACMIVALGMLGQFLLGFARPVFNINQLSLRQSITPDRLQGRVNATMRFIMWGVTPVGAILGGILGAMFYRTFSTA